MKPVRKCTWRRAGRVKLRFTAVTSPKLPFCKVAFKGRRSEALHDTEHESLRVRGLGGLSEQVRVSVECRQKGKPFTTQDSNSLRKQRGHALVRGRLIRGKPDRGDWSCHRHWQRERVQDACTVWRERQGREERWLNEKKAWEPAEARDAQAGKEVCKAPIVPADRA